MRILRVLITICALALVLAGCGGVIAEQGDTVKVHYIGRLDDGSVFDTSEGKDPLEFIVGDGKMISGFDAAVRGMKAGETKTVNIPADNAYGQYNEDLVIEIPLENISSDSAIVVGMQLQIITPNGQMLLASIIEVKEDSVVADANPSLAGEDLTFEITMVEIEKAES